MSKLGQTQLVLKYFIVVRHLQHNSFEENFQSRVFSEKLKDDDDCFYYYKK